MAKVQNLGLTTVMLHPGVGNGFMYIVEYVVKYSEVDATFRIG